MSADHLPPRPVANEVRPRLLVIEDDADIRLFMTRALDGEGYEVSCAADAHEALRLLTSGLFDVVLTDFGLPGMDGLALLAEAEQKGLLRGTRVMVLTALPWIARDTQVPVLLKPVDLDELTGRLRLMLETDCASTPARR